jgi:pilus assembly protein CpaC
VRMSPSVSRLIASEITRSLAKNGYPDVRAEGIGDKVFLEGTVTQKDDIEAVGNLSAAYFQPSVNLVTLAGRQEELVMIDINFVELGRNLGEKIGVNWDDSARFDITNLNYTIGILRAGSDTGSMSMNMNNYGASIDVSETKSLARSLAHPKLVCKSGEKAGFLAGGEVPYAVSGIGGGTVQFREYGIRLKISPIMHRDGRISAGVEAESSSLDFANSVQGYPALKTRRVDTFVTLGKGQVLALSGLVNQTDSKDVEKVPVIGSFPIIGELFKSRNFQNNDTELVIFLAAELLSAESEANKEQVQSIQEKYEKTKEQLQPRLSD